MKLKIFLVLAPMLFAIKVLAENVRASVVFKKWLDIQEVFPDIKITDAQQQLNDDFVITLKNRYESTLPFVTTVIPLLSSLTNNLITEQGYAFKPPLNQTMSNNFSQLYQVVEQDMPTFVTYLATMLPDLTMVENQEQKVEAILERNIALTRLLFVHKNVYHEHALSFALANRIFEYCFDSKTSPHFQNLLLNYDARPTVHFLLSIMWNYFVGEGWQNWHKSSLDLIKNYADQGHEIVYLAGGNDIFALITKGIYNIRIIDPFLPTQTRYYADGWDFLIHGTQTIGINDEIQFGPLCNNIVMKRTAYTEGESFCVKLSNNTFIEIKKSITTWQVSDVDSNFLGTITFERRLVNQHDFMIQPDKKLLIAFNELTYATIPGSLGGWDIDLTILPNDFQIIVKQLRRPIAKDTLCALRLTSLVNFSDIKFINLGSVPK